MEDLPSALILVLDLNQGLWAQRRNSGWPSIEEVLESLMTFCRAFFLLHAGNNIAVIGAHAGGAELLYPLPSHQRPQPIDDADDDSGKGNKGSGKKKKRKGDVNALEGLEMDSVDKYLHAAIVDLAKRIPCPASGTNDSSSASMVSSAFAMAACRFNRILADKSPKRPMPRLLVIAPFEDLPGQYIPIMNSIFSFQKGGVLVDAIAFCDNDCRLLQQAADITHGAYLRPSPSDLADGALLQYMLTVFLPDKRCRFIDASLGCSKSLLRLPRPKQVDYRAACFKTTKPIDIGFVCSVCLAIYAEPVFVCTICDSKMEVAAKPGAAAAAGGPATKKKKVSKESSSV